jgi:hypothetical protein
MTPNSLLIVKDIGGGKQREKVNEERKKKGVGEGLKTRNPH